MTPHKHIRTFRSKKLHPEHAKLLNEAIRKNARGGEHNVHISYTKGDGTKSERKVKPLAVKGKSLFVAHCHERNAIRSFKVERISMVKQAFWDGFEKRAISTKYIAKGITGRMRNQKRDYMAKVLNLLFPGKAIKENHRSLELALKNDILPAVKSVAPHEDPVKMKHLGLRGFVRGFSEAYPKGK
jgi:hypothetical protein